MRKNAKEEIVQALQILMQKKELDKITVKELIEKAGINRSTYYYHFYKIDDVFEYVMNIFCESFKKTVDVEELYSFNGKNVEYMHKKTEELFMFLEKNKDKIQMIRKSKYKHEFYNRLIDIFLDSYKSYEHYYDDVPMSHRDAQYWDYNTAYGIIAGIECWAQRGFEEDPSDLTKLQYKLVEYNNVYIKAN